MECEDDEIKVAVLMVVNTQRLSAVARAMGVLPEPCTAALLRA